MASLDDIYGGIIKPGPQGGIYQPGPDVVFPGSDVSRVTPEGLNVRSVTTTPIDARTGLPINSGGSLRPSEAQLQAIRTIAKALQAPISHTAISTQERLTDTPPQMLAFDGDQHTGQTMEPGLAAIDNATQPWGLGPRPRPFAAPLFGEMPKPNGVAVPDTMGLRGVPAQGFARAPSTIPPVRPVMVAPQQRSSIPPGQVMIASGKVVPVGATGTAQGGRYSYAVQSDGSIAKTINPTPVATSDSSYFAGSRQQAQQNTLKALGFHGDGY